MANLYIDGKRIVPAPLYSISHEINRTAGGVILSCNYNISLTGSILADRGYPTSTGAFSTSTSDTLDIIETGINTQQASFKSLLNKQAALKELTLLEGTGYGSNRLVSIINTTGGGNGQTNDKIEFNYFASNIEFDASTTTSISNYTISFSANDVRLNGRSINPASGSFQDYNLRSASDSFNTVRNTDRDATISITRNLRAQGYKSYDADVQSNISAVSGWQFAKEWIKAQLPLDPRSSPSVATNGVPLVSFPAGYGYVGASLTEDVDKLGGEYGVTVSWMYAPLNASGIYYAADDYSITKNDTIVGNKTNYKISGTVKGTNSNDKSDAYTAALTFLSQNINPTILRNRISTAFSVPTSVIIGPMNSVQTHNDFGGTINYEYDFYKKIASLPACFFDVELNVSKNSEERVIAEVPIPGRTNGPIIQDIKTKQTKKRSVTANFTLSSSGANFIQMDDYKTSGTSFLTSLGAVPSGTENIHHWKTSFSHNLDIIGGRYSMNIGYVET